jgi:protein-disulfide isomerase
MPSNAPRLTKTERRDAARREAERLAAKQKAAESRNRLIILGASLLVVVLIVVAGLIIWQQSGRTALTEFEGERPGNSDDQGGIVLGDPAEGATEIDLYMDFLCPVCRQFDEVNRDDIRTMVEGGDVTVKVHPLGFLDRLSNGTQYSTRSANAFATVATDAPDSAVDFMEALFDNQPAEGGPGLTDEELAQIAVEAGVPQDVADTFASGTYIDWVSAGSDQARSDGVTGTPTTFIAGERFEGNGQQPGTVLAAVQEAG